MRDGLKGLEQRVRNSGVGVRMSLEPFQTVILASGTVSAPGPGKEIESVVSKIGIIGDAKEVADIYSATQAGYQLACRYS